MGTYQFAEIKGTKIHFEDVAALTGEGTAVVFIHAGIVDLNMWDDQMEIFTKNHRVVRYDMRGWGETAMPAGEFSDVADLRGLLGHLGVEKTAVVGCSFGGKTAVDFAISHPEMVSSLVLVGAALGGFDWQDADIGEKDAAMEAAYDRGEFELSAELDTQIWFDGPNRTPEQVDADVRARVYEMVLRCHQLPEPVGAKRIGLEPPAIERLAELVMPTLVLVGEGDAADIRAIGELLAARLARVELVMMADTAHLPNMEKPDEFNRLVLSFLERAKWQSVVYGVLLDEAGERIWLRKTDKGLALPCLSIMGGYWDTGSQYVKRPFREQLGDVHPLYRAAYEFDEASGRTESVFVLEKLGKLENGSFDKLRAGRWLTRDALATELVDEPALVEKVWQVWQEQGESNLRPAWEKADWLAEVEGWIGTQLAKRGERLVKPIELVRSWSLSCVLRAEASSAGSGQAIGFYYFKVVADLPLFVNEAVFLQKLGELYPQKVPALVAIEPERGWFLTADLGATLGWSAPLERRQAMLADYGGWQRTAVADVDRLLAMGCLDRRLDRLPAQIEKAFTEDFVLAGAATAADRERLMGLIPLLQALCGRLAAYGVPETLVHGDLHGDNVALADDGEFVYFDWTDACISHPFFDMLVIFFERDTAVRVQLRDAYLAEWTDVVPMAQLLEMWPLAELLAGAHHVVSYWQILANIEPTDHVQMGNILPFWFGRILKLSEAFDGS